MKKNRYFIISYTYSNKNGFGFGQMNLKTENSYPARGWLCNHLKKNNNGEVVILNITELKEKDIKDWIKDEKTP